MGDRRIGGGLRASFRLLALAVNVFVAFVEAEGAKLYGCSVNLTVARHANGLLLIQNSSLEAGGPARSLGRRLHSRGGKAAGGR